MKLSIMFFASQTTGWAETYQLVLDAAEIADRAGLDAVWTPERHYDRFGGAFPNPAILAAAIIMRTSGIDVRAGSVVAPLRSPVTLAEEWALLDQLSGGRVGLSLTSGWHAADFVTAPENFEHRKGMLAGYADLLRRLWRGEALDLPDGAGIPRSTRAFPRPVGEGPTLWTTCSGRTETFGLAGRTQTHVLTHLLSQDRARLATNIAAYRRARRLAGHRAGAGRVTLMLHTYLDDDAEAAMAKALPPLTDYMRHAMELERGGSPDLASAPEGLLKELVADRAWATARDRSLIGSVESVAARIADLSAAGVGEIACLIDFGLPPAEVVRGVERLARLNELLAAHAEAAR